MKFLISALLLALTGCVSVPERMDIDDYEPEYLNYEQPVKYNGSIFSQSVDVNPYGDDTATNVGDVVTVMLMESMSASKSSNSNTNKSTTTSLDPVNMLGKTITTGYLDGVDLSMDLSSQNKFTGGGAASQSNEIDGTITVTVNRVLPNGNLFVKGEKWIKINTGEELVRLSGVIRPRDIASGNRIESTKIADARIVYSGQGFVKDATEPGLMYKVFNNSWWPF